MSPYVKDVCRTFSAVAIEFAVCKNPMIEVNKWNLTQNSYVRMELREQEKINKAVRNSSKK